MAGKTSSPKSAKTAGPPPESVEEFLEALDPAVRKEIRAVRETILSADPTITEGIKWNVASFRTSEYFATVNLRAKNGFGILLHFGAKKGDVAKTGVAIPDPDGLLEWLAKDRAMVTFRDLGDFAARRSAFATLIRQWIRHV